MSASRRRMAVLYVVVASLLITLGGRLWYIQVMNGTSYVKLASANQTRNIIVPAVRGQILDDVGNALVTNRTALVVSVDMMTLSQRRTGVPPCCTASRPCSTCRTSCCRTRCGCAVPP